MSEEYIKGDTLLPWAPFHSALTDHDKQAIAELNATGAAKVAAAKEEAKLKQQDKRKIARAAKTWGKAPCDGMRWNSIKARWE
jgi:hypothetical protein